MGEGNTAGVNTEEYEVLSAAIALQDLVSDASENSGDVAAVHHLPHGAPRRDDGANPLGPVASLRRNIAISFLSGLAGPGLKVGSARG